MPLRFGPQIQALPRGAGLTDPLGPLLERQLRILARPEIVAAPNRRGLRKKTGDLLERAYVDLVALLAPDLSIEVGAHEASHSLAVKARSPQTTALAFEANPHVHAHFSPKLAREAARIDYRHAAVTDREGICSLSIPRRSALGAFDRMNRISSLLARDRGAFEYEQVEVPATTLDRVGAETACVSASLWIDVEGAQRQVLDGAKMLLRKALAVFIEVEEQPIWQGQQIADTVDERLRAAGLVEAMRDSLARSQHNRVYLRRDHVRSRTDIVSRIGRYCSDLTKIVSPEA